MTILCLWPGLAAAWINGDLRGLVLSVGFGWATSLLIMATFVWPQWISPFLVNTLWIAHAIFWFAETGRSLWTFKSISKPETVAQSPAFLEAQEHYIRGNWFDAEALLLNIIQETPRDAEAQLLLASALRHTKRWQAALRRLEQLEFLQAASNWRFEIQQERSLIKRAIAEEAETDDSDPNDSPSEPSSAVNDEDKTASESSQVSTSATTIGITEEQPPE